MLPVDIIFKKEKVAIVLQTIKHGQSVWKICRVHASVLPLLRLYSKKKIVRDEIGVG